MLLLLDTHTWIWSVDGDTRRIGSRARRRLARAAAEGQVRVSTASVFELVALCAASRLKLSRSPEQWVRGALASPGVRVIDLSMEMALDAGQITRGALADPIDRLLVATARQLDAEFMTADAPILAYAAETGRVRVVHAGR